MLVDGKAWWVVFVGPAAVFDTWGRVRDGGMAPGLVDPYPSYTQVSDDDFVVFVFTIRRQPMGRGEGGERAGMEGCGDARHVCNTMEFPPIHAPGILWG